MHLPGIEPGSRPWQGRILPLDHRCLHASRSGPGRDRTYDLGVISTTLYRLSYRTYHETPAVGLEPTTTRLRVLRSTD